MKIKNTWEQNTNIICRILLCHAQVEHFIDKYLKIKHPKIDFRVVNLTWSEKIDSYRLKTNPHLTPLLSGIKNLDIIKERLVRNLKGEISNSEIEVFLSNPRFQADRMNANKPHLPSDEAIVILEDFTIYDCRLFHSLSTP